LLLYLDTKAKLENLKFKLELLQILHKGDDLFQVHRTCKRIIINFFTILFSIGMANGINYLLTKNAFFCNKTSTQNKIDRTHAMIGLDKNKEISYQSTLHHTIETATQLPNEVVDLIIGQFV
jgi:hypothetical protein